MVAVLVVRHSTVSSQHGHDGVEGPELQMDSPGLHRCPCCVSVGRRVPELQSCRVVGGAGDAQTGLSAVEGTRRQRPLAHEPAHGGLPDQRRSDHIVTVNAASVVARIGREGHACRDPALPGNRGFSPRGDSVIRVLRRCHGLRQVPRNRAMPNWVYEEAFHIDCTSTRHDARDPTWTGGSRCPHRSVVLEINNTSWSCAMRRLAGQASNVAPTRRAHWHKQVERSQDLLSRPWQPT
ncbi:hypothetical protein H310_05969 [Aphanomyces invadans]|uniref:Uncharacterized protein n=1 Tax=Aphanomyces invadans TaxID=157072 RepID=A0A024U8D9_9STRA|nr:hypothetical protein H310_05969 [Aphanomyces invadans]ETW02460.1 hypothetical protein H310_05969 [Aphanomyces invadans]|eukprot:XP_008869065.1 hypothetical protein H310_05969 [Aphanomyces invadans]